MVPHISIEKIREEYFVDAIFLDPMTGREARKNIAVFKSYNAALEAKSRILLAEAESPGCTGFFPAAKVGAP